MNAVQLERFADTYRLGPLLSRRILPQVRDRLPRRLDQRWQDAYVRQWLANESLLGTFDEIRRAFVAAGEPFLLLKGPSLGVRLYGDIGQRSYEDIDILVRDERATACLRWLTAELGFTSPVRHQRLHRALTHAKPLYRGDVGIDLHWALRQHPSFAIDGARVWETRRSMILPGRAEARVDVLSDEYALLLTMLGIFDDLSRLETPLKGMVDAFLMLRELDDEMDWDRFLARRRAEGVERIVVDVGTMLLELFDADSLLPRLAAALAVRGVGQNRGVAICLQPVSRVRALWSYRLALYRIPRPIALAYLLATAPILKLLMERGRRRDRGIPG